MHAWLGYVWNWMLNIVDATLNVAIFFSLLLLFIVIFFRSHPSNIIDLIPQYRIWLIKVRETTLEKK